MAVTASLCKNLPEYMNTLSSVIKVHGEGHNCWNRVLDSGKGFQTYT